jgi:hypothetical protein
MAALAALLALDVFRARAIGWRLARSAHEVTDDPVELVRVLIYNIPYRTGVNLANDTLLALAELPGIAGVKGLLGQYRAIRSSCCASGPRASPCSPARTPTSTPCSGL